MAGPAGPAGPTGPAGPPGASPTSIDGGTIPIQLKRFATSGGAPASLVQGEVAINSADGALFWADQTGVVTKTPLKKATAAVCVAGTDDASLVTPAGMAAAIIAQVPLCPIKPTGATSTSDIPDLIARLGLTPYDVGATDDGNNDQIPYWNTAISRLQTAGGGALIIPPSVSSIKRWMMKSAVVVTGANISIIGLTSSVQIYDPRTSGDAFNIGTASTPVYYFTLSNIYHTNNVQKTSGRCMNLNNVNLSRIENFVFDRAIDGINGTTLNSVLIRNGQIVMPYQTTNTGIYFHDTVNSTRSDIIKIEEVTVQAHNAGSYGLTIDGPVNGLHTHGCYLLGCNRGLQILNTAQTTDSQIPSFCTFEKLETDRALDTSVIIDAGFHILFVRPEISNTSGAMDTPYPQGSNDNHVFLVTNGSVSGGAAAPDTIIIQGGKIHNGRRSALCFQGKRVMVSGIYFEDASKITNQTSTSHEPVVHALSGATDFIISGCSMNGTGRASYPVVIENGATRGIVKHCIFSNCNNPNVANLATGTTIVGDNILGNAA